MLEFRNATREDLPVIVEIYNSTVPGRMVTADTEPVSVESRFQWFQDHEPSRRPLWIVCSENQPVGWVSFQSFYGRPAYNATAEISIYVHENFRGIGFGKQILDHAMQKCESLQIKTLLGYIFAHNLPSINLFREKGFSEWGLFPKIAVLDGIERDLVILGKRVNK
jgi:L-amino acid N-acyltransferase YncA